MNGYRASLKTLPSHSSSESAEVPAVTTLATAPELSFVTTPKRMAQVRAADPPEEPQGSETGEQRQDDAQPLEPCPGRLENSDVLYNGG